MRYLLLIIVAVALAAVAGFAFDQRDHAGPAQATHAGGADNFSVDMDPAAAPANSAASVGSVEVCARINENDITDADEDAVDTLEFDIVTGPAGIPAGNPMIGFSTSLSYPSANLTVVSTDVNLLLDNTPGSNVFDASGPSASDPDLFDIAAVDLSDPTSGTAEAGPGVLARVTVATTAASPGVYPLILSFPGHIDPVDDAFVPDNVNDGNIAIDQPCPPPADLEVTSASVNAPATAPAGSSFAVIVNGTIANNGPATPVNADAMVTLNVPPDCTVDSNSVTVQDLSLTFGAPTELPPQNFSVTCTNPSFHSFSASVTVVENDPNAVEGNGANNSLTSPTATTAIIASADLAIVGVAVSAATTVVSGTPFFVPATVDYRNNGPFGPVDSFVITSVLALPAGCTSYGGPSQAVGVAAVPTSTTFSLHLLWSVTCSQTLTHTFAVTARAGVDHVHVADSDSTNDTLTRAAPGATVVGPASLPRTGGASDGSNNGRWDSFVVLAAMIASLVASALSSSVAVRRRRA